MVQRAPDNIFRFRRLKWAAPKVFKVLPDSAPRRVRRPDRVVMVLIAAIDISLVVSGVLLADEVAAVFDRASG